MIVGESHLTHLKKLSGRKNYDPQDCHLRLSTGSARLLSLALALAHSTERARGLRSSSRARKLSETSLSLALTLATETTGGLRTTRAGEVPKATLLTLSSKTRGGGTKATGHAAGKAGVVTLSVSLTVTTEAAGSGGEGRSTSAHGNRGASTRGGNSLLLGGDHGEEEGGDERGDLDHFD